ncbi:MAG: response regulator [Burkholderiales bacterium]|nr:response regulator [Anaerolineae bacterium]
MIEDNYPERRQIREIEAELRQNTLNLTLIFTSATIWLIVLIANLFWGVLPMFVLAVWVTIQCTALVSFWLKGQHLAWASWLLVAGLWLANALSVGQSSIPSTLYLFAAVGVVASVLVGGNAAIAFTALSTLFAALLMAGGFVPPPVGISAVLIFWIVVGMNHIALNSLRQTLVMMNNFQNYIVEQVRELRERRAQLAQLTKALVEATEKLEYANVQLRHARATAEEARMMKAQFAANVSHELRTPINLIVGFAEMMVSAPDSYGGALPSAYWKDITTIYRNGKHLQGLINDVLDMSQIEAGQMAMVKEEVAADMLLLETADLIRDSIAAKGIMFDIDVPDDLPTIWLDRVRIRQVVLNLLGNAVRFTDSGHIHLRAWRENDQIHIQVKDTGMGIPPQEVNRVFEEFYQMEGSLSRRHGGSGLGLTLSKQFIEMHGGRIGVESAGIPGEGSAFWFTLPLVDQLRASGHGQRGSLIQSEHKRYFVVLDDDPVMRQLFERYTNKHHALSAQTISEALKLVRAVQPAALVVDQQVMVQAAADENLRTLLDEAASITPIIQCQMPSGRRAMQLRGVSDYLVKPVSMENLETTLKRLAIPIHNILVIDDDQDIVRLYDRMLKTLSPAYQIRKAYGGAEGLAMMNRTPPDVVILDLLMPEMDGFGVIDAMQAAPALNSIPIILASAYGASEGITPFTQGELIVSRSDGFQPIELVRCIENLVDALRPANAN